MCEAHRIKFARRIALDVRSITIALLVKLVPDGAYDTIHAIVYGPGNEHLVCRSAVERL